MSDLPLADGFFATPHRFLWHSPSATAVLSDVHLGAEISLRQQGFHLPDTATKPLRAAWHRLVERNPNRVIIAGDLFDSPHTAEESLPLLNELLADLPTACIVTLTPGNHDPDPAALARLLPSIKVELATTVGGWNVLHGDDTGLLSPAAAGVIVGHQHPAVVLATRVQSAKMFCYAVGSVTIARKKCPLVILPPFSRAPLGSNLLTERNWILDFPRPDPPGFEVIGLIEPRQGVAQVLHFGRLGSL